MLKLVDVVGTVPAAAQHLAVLPAALAAAGMQLVDVDQVLLSVMPMVVRWLLLGAAAHSTPPKSAL